MTQTYSRPGGMSAAEAHKTRVRLAGGDANAAQEQAPKMQVSRPGVALPHESNILPTSQPSRELIDNNAPVVATMTEIEKIASANKRLQAARKAGKDVATSLKIANVAVAKASPDSLLT